MTSPLRREEHIILHRLGFPLPIGDFEDGFQAIGDRLVGTEDPEVPRILVQLDHVAKEPAEHVHVAGLDGGGRGHAHRVVAEVRHAQLAQQFPAIGVGIGTHPSVALRAQLGQFGQEPAALVEELFRLVAPHPALELLEMLGRSRGRHGERHLMGPERALDRQAIDEFRSGPALERSEDDHRPARASGVALDAGVVLDLPDLLDHPIEGRGHRLMHLLRLVPLDEVRRPAVAEEQVLQFLVGDACEDGRVGDLEAVEVQDRQHHAVGDRVEELVGMPCGGQRAGLGFAVADDAGDDQVRIVERGPEGMADRIAQLAAFMNRPRRLRRNVAGDPSGEGELLEQLLQPGLILADVRIDLAVRAFEVDVAHHRRGAVAGTGDVDHVEVMLLDDPVQMRVDEVLARSRAPVSQQQLFHMLQLQRLPKQRVVAEIDLADGQVIRGPPVGIDLAELFRVEGTLLVRRLRGQSVGGPGRAGLFRRKRTLRDFECRHRLSP